MFSLFRRLRSVSPRRPLRPRSYRPQFDILEDRCVPATFTVTDTGDLAADPGSLRGILSGAAGALTTGSTINFAAALNGQTITIGSSLPQIAVGLTITGAGLSSGITINGNGFVIFSYNAAGGNQPQVINGLTLSGAATAAATSGSAISIGQGGAGNAATGTLTLTNSTITGNTSAFSTTGAIYDNSTGALSITNSTFTANSTSGAAGEGSAVWFRGAPATLTNDTISGNTNSMTGAGGAIDIVGAGVLTVINTIASGNTTNGTEADIVGGTIGAGSFNNLVGTVGTASPGVLVNGTQGNIVGVNNPVLGPLQNNGGPTFTLEVLAGSQALLNGTATGAPAADQRGVTRSGGINIGAYQASASTLLVAGFPSPQVQGVSGNFTVTALDPFGKTAIGYRGMVQFTSSDTKAVLPAAYTFLASDNGVHVFAATFNTVGTQTLTVTDAATGTINGTQSGIVITAAVVPPVPNEFFAIGAGAGGGPQVVVYNAKTGAIVSSFFAFTPTFTGGVQVAVADVNGDGTADIIVAAGAGGGPQVIVIDGTKLTQLLSSGQIAPTAVLASFFAYAPTFTGGVNLAAAVSASGKPEIVVGAGATGGSEVEVIDATKLNQVQSNGQIGNAAVLSAFYAFLPTFTGGVRVALGDVNGDGTLDVIAGAGFGGGPQVIVVDGTKLTQVQSSGQIASSALLASFYAFLPSFTGGVFVSAGVTVAGGNVNVIVSADAGGGPAVEVINGTQLGQVQSNGQIAPTALLASFNALPATFTGGVRIGFSAAFGSSGKPAILTAAGPTGGPEVNPFDAGTLNTLGAFFALPSGFTGGVFVAG